MARKGRVRKGSLQLAILMIQKKLVGEQVVQCDTQNRKKIKKKGCFPSIVLDEKGVNLIPSEVIFVHTVVKHAKCPRKVNHD